MIALVFPTNFFSESRLNQQLINWLPAKKIRIAENVHTGTSGFSASARAQAYLKSESVDVDEVGSADFHLLQIDGAPALSSGR